MTIVAYSCFMNERKRFTDQVSDYVKQFVFRLYEQITARKGFETEIKQKLVVPEWIDVINPDAVNFLNTISSESLRDMFKIIFGYMEKVNYFRQGAIKDKYNQVLLAEYRSFLLNVHKPYLDSLVSKNKLSDDNITIGKYNELVIMIDDPDRQKHPFGAVLTVPGTQKELFDIIMSVANSYREEFAEELQVIISKIPENKFKGNAIIAIVKIVYPNLL